MTVREGRREEKQATKKREKREENENERRGEKKSAKYCQITSKKVQSRQVKKVMQSPDELKCNGNAQNKLDLRYRINWIQGTE